MGNGVDNEGGVDIDQKYWELVTGSGKSYSTVWDDCPRYPDPLAGILYAGESATGNACFVIPERETGLILVHNPEWSERKRYLSLGSAGDLN